jgi:uncharacterized protein with NRDE domain
MTIEQAAYLAPMCTLLFAWQMDADTPIIVAANRDEFRERLAEPPQQLVASPRIFGGRDLLARGTWLAVDPDGGRVAAVTNRHPRHGSLVRDPSRKSRGELPVRLLETDDEGAKTLLQSLSANDYNPADIVYLSLDHAFWTSIDPEVGNVFSEIAPGLHEVTQYDMDDRECNKDRRILESLSSRPTTATAITSMFEGLLRSHDFSLGEIDDAICAHGENYGTVSSALVSITRDGTVSYRHADGQPCETAFVSVDLEDRVAG